MALSQRTAHFRDTLHVPSLLLSLRIVCQFTLRHLCFSTWMDPRARRVVSFDWNGVPDRPDHLRPLWNTRTRIVSDFWNDDRFSLRS